MSGGSETIAFTVDIFQQMQVIMNPYHENQKSINTDKMMPW